MNRYSAGKLAFVMAALAATPAFAHVGIGATSGLAAGFAHPLFGLDHLLVMVSVGLWAGLVGGRALWVWPAAFVGVMIVGGAMGMAGIAMPFVEPMILASVVALGLAVALAIRAPVWLGAVMIGAFALFHGHAHGTEVPETAAGIEYLAGFALATAILHGVGITLAVGTTHTGLSKGFIRAMGAAVAVAGIALAAG